MPSDVKYFTVQELNHTQLQAKLFLQ